MWLKTNVGWLVQGAYRNFFARLKQPISAIVNVSEFLFYYVSIRVETVQVFSNIWYML